MKDIATPVPPEEMKNLVQKCLEKAAAINYSQLMEYAQVKGEGHRHCPKHAESAGSQTMARIGSFVDGWWVSSA